MKYVTIIILCWFYPNLLNAQIENPWFFEDSPALNVDIGPDTIFCYPMSSASYYLGTNLVIENGHPPYRYAWECNVVYGGYLRFGASSFLHDTTSPTPNFKEPLENNSSQKFILHIWDNQENYAKDSINVRFSRFGYLLGHLVHYLGMGDSILFTPGSVNLGGGIPPLTYRWNPTNGLSDTLSLKTWCKPLVSRDYFVIARDSAGCVSEPSLAHQIYVSLVGTENFAEQNQAKLNLRQLGPKVLFNNPIQMPTRIRLFNISGNIVFSVLTQDAEFDVGKRIHGKGLFMVQVENHIMTETIIFHWNY